jgi:hypothetical protein
LGGIASAHGARSLFTSAAVTHKPAASAATTQPGQAGQGQGQGPSSYSSFGSKLFPEPLAQCQFADLPLATQLAVTLGEGPSASLVSSSHSLGMAALSEQRAGAQQQFYGGAGGGLVRATLAPRGGGSRGAATRATIALSQAADMADVEYGATSSSTVSGTPGGTVGGATQVYPTSTLGSPGRAGGHGGGVMQVTLDASIRR